MATYYKPSQNPGSTNGNFTAYTRLKITESVNVDGNYSTVTVEYQTYAPNMTLSGFTPYGTITLNGSAMTPSGFAYTAGADWTTAFSKQITVYHNATTGDATLSIVVSAHSSTYPNGFTYYKYYGGTQYSSWLASGTYTVPLTHIDLGSKVHIDNGSSMVEHYIYIDNGSAWEQYDAYIDNGSSWDKI